MTNELCQCKEPAVVRPLTPCRRCGKPLVVQRTLPDGTVEIEGRKMGGKDVDPNMPPIDWRRS